MLGKITQRQWIFNIRMEIVWEDFPYEKDDLYTRIEIFRGELVSKI